MNLVVETPYRGGWNKYRMITNVEGDKVILVDGEEIEFEKLRVKEIEFNRILFV